MIEFNEPEAKENAQFGPDPMIELSDEIESALIIHCLTSLSDSLDRCAMHFDEDLEIKTRIKKIIKKYMTRYMELSASLKQTVAFIIGELTARAEFCSKTSASLTVDERLKLADLDITLSIHIQTIKTSCQKLLEESEHLITEMFNAISYESSIANFLIKFHYNSINMSKIILKAHYEKWLSFWAWFEKLSDQQVVLSENQCDLACLLLSGNNIRTVWAIILKFFLAESRFISPHKCDGCQDTEKQIELAISKKLNFTFNDKEKVVPQLLIEAGIVKQIKLGNLERVMLYSLYLDYSKYATRTLTNFSYYAALALSHQKREIFYFLWNKYLCKKISIELFFVPFIAATAVGYNDESKFLIQQISDIIPVLNFFASIAIKYNNLEIITYLLSNGVNHNTGNSLGAISFYPAIKNKNLEMIDLLIRAGIFFNISGNENYTYFEYAVLFSSIEVAHFILKKMIETPSVMSNWIKAIVHKHKRGSIELRFQNEKNKMTLAKRIFLSLVTCAEQEMIGNPSSALIIYDSVVQLLTSRTIAHDITEEDRVALRKAIRQVTEYLSKQNGELIKNYLISNITPCAWTTDPSADYLRLAVTDKKSFNRIKKTLRDIPSLDIANSSVIVTDLARINVAQLIEILSSANTKAIPFKEKHHELSVTSIPEAIVITPVSYTLQKPNEHLVAVTEDHSEEKKTEQQPLPNLTVADEVKSHFYSKLPTFQFFSKQNPSSYVKANTAKANIAGYLIMDYVNSNFGDLENNTKLCIARETLEKKSPGARFNFELFYLEKKLEDSKVKVKHQEPLQTKSPSKTSYVGKSNLDFPKAIKKYKLDDRNVGNDRLVFAKRCQDKFETISSILARMNKSEQNLEANSLLLKMKASHLLNDYKNFYQQLRKNILDAKATCQLLNLNFDILFPQLEALPIQDFDIKFPLHQDIISYALFHNALCLFEATAHYLSGKEQNIVRNLRNMIEHVITDQTLMPPVIDFALQVTDLMKFPLSKGIKQNIPQLQRTELFAFFNDHLSKPNYDNWSLRFCLNTIKNELVKAFLFTLFLKPTDIGLTDVYQICIDATKHAFTKIGVLYTYMRNHNLLADFSEHPKLKEFLRDSLAVKIQVGHDSGVSCLDELYISFDEISPKKVFEMAKESIIHCLSLQKMLTDVSTSKNKLNPDASAFKP
jgi:hypothetical protein